jgi:hypothetical protein
MNTTAAKQSGGTSGARKNSGRIIGIAGGVLIVGIIIFSFMFIRMNYVPADLDTSTRLTSAQGLYVISYSPETGSVPLNQMQKWTLHVETPDGQPVENAAITVDGDMPQHGHGLSSRPQVTQYLGNGDYQVEGLRFHMPGWWVVDFVVNSEGQSDSVRFNLTLR